MDKVLTDLKEKTRRFAEIMREGHYDKETCDRLILEIVYAAAELYKRDDIVLYVPVTENGPYVYQERDKLYYPLCINKNPKIQMYQEVSFRDSCNYVSDNIYHYEMLMNPEEILNQEMNYSDLIEYAKKNHKLEGIILDPECDDLFGFEGWILQAVMYKGMGVDTFHVIDEKTGEKKHEI